MLNPYTVLKLGIGKTIRFLSEIFNWQLRGQKIELTISEVEEESFLGKKLSGTILDFGEKVVTKSNRGFTKNCKCVVLKLDHPFKFREKSYQYLAGITRYMGSDFFDLFFNMPVSVYIYPISSPNMPDVLNWKDILVISVLRFKKKV